MSREFESDIRGERFVGDELDGARFTKCHLIDCDFSGASMRDASLYDVEFRGCRLSGVIMSGASMRGVRFVECKLDDANFRMATGDKVWFEDSVLIGADFYSASLPGTVFARCDLSGVEFSKCAIADGDLRGSRLDGIKGAIALAGVTIDSAQLVPLALSIYAAMQITVDDGDDGAAP